jgi:HEAT repeat protein
VEDATDDPLTRCLRAGLAARADDDLRVLLATAADADDRTLAAELISKVAAQERVRLAQGGARPRARASLPVEVDDATFLGRLKPEGTADELGVSSLDDVPTLLLVLRAGSLGQRRAAARRLAHKLEQVELSSDDVRRVESTVEGLRDVELGFELALCRAALPSGRTREAQRQARAQAELVARVSGEVRGYWEGEQVEEPITTLSGDDRASLLLHSRALPDTVLAHVSALIEGDAGASQLDQRRAVIAAVRYAGDPRLAPALLGALDEGNEHVVIEAARALSRIDDPRVQPALAAAYQRSVVDIERIALGAALGRVGDVRSRDYVRAQLSSQDEHVLSRALEALRTVGTVEDVPLVMPFLASEDTVLVAKAAHTLGRIGDGRSVAPLHALANEAVVGSVRAAAEEALDQVRARLQLRGEEAPSGSLAVAVADEPGTETASFSVRLRAIRLFVAARLWQLIGARNRALTRFEQAAQCWQAWALPPLMAGLLHMSSAEYALALPLFRRALEAERRRIEHSPLLMRYVAACFLRRAEQVERDGRHAIARGLLDEVLSLDLRRVPSSLRFEIGRRHEAMRLTRAA